MSSLGGGYRLFSVEHSIFSAKVRALMRFKLEQGDLGAGFEDVLATPHLINRWLTPKSGSPSLPQLETPDGGWVQDSSAIVDYLERIHPASPVVPDADLRPRQHLACYLIELLSDEWLIVPACWERWHFSQGDNEPNHRRFNEQQWGAFLKPEGNGKERRQAAATFFDRAFGIDLPPEEKKGPYQGLVELGCTLHTLGAWRQFQEELLTALERHLEQHDYVLGGRPSLADFSLLGPIYVHFCRDPVAGFDLRTRFPLVSEWVERTNAENSLNARKYGQKLYKVDDSGVLVAFNATSDGGAWLADDTVPPTVMPILRLFFDEMWPYLSDSIDVLTDFIGSAAHALGDELPRKTFTASPGFEALQRDQGELTTSFSIKGIASRRMVVPYQMWMLQRMISALSPDQTPVLERWLDQFSRGKELLLLNERLKRCALEKRGGLLFSRASS